MSRVNPVVLGIFFVGIVILVVATLMITRTPSKGERLGGSRSAAVDSDAQKPCASRTTYNAIQRELFRQAAETRGSDEAAFDRIASYSALRVEKPILKSRDEEIGTMRCGGRLSLDLPPGVAVVGGRRTLSADIDYILQPAADGSGNVVIFEGADPIIVPLATLARMGTHPDASKMLPSTEIAAVDSPQQNIGPAVAEPPAPPQPVPTPRTEVAANASVRPSFNCRYARTRGEVSVCSDSGLASLDRQMASQFYRAVANGTPRQRELLRTTRNSFLRYRDSCRSDSCIAGAYRDRMAEIRDITEGRWQPNR